MSIEYLMLSYFTFFLLNLYMKTDTITNLCKYLSLAPTNDGLGKLKKTKKKNIDKGKHMWSGYFFKYQRANDI